MGPLPKRPDRLKKIKSIAAKKLDNPQYPYGCVVGRGAAAPKGPMTYALSASF